MSFGPEFIQGLATTLDAKLKDNPWRITRVEGGESWVALKVTGTGLKNAGDSWLLLSWGAGSSGCCLASGNAIAALKSGAPARTPLVEALKSRAVRGDLIAAHQLEHDRILELILRRRVVAGTSISYTLVLEVTEPVANLVLLSNSSDNQACDGIIEEVARHAAPAQNHYRTLLPGHKYVTPPPFKGTLPEELKTLTFEAVANLKGIGRPLVRAIQSHWDEYSPSQWLAALQTLSSADSEAKYYVIGKNYITRFGIALKEHTQIADKDKQDILDIFDVASLGVLTPLLERGRGRRLREIGVRLERAAKSRERHRDGLRKQLKDCAAAEVYRKKGELILAHIHEIPPRAESVMLSDWGDNPEESGKLEIALDPNLTPSKNAERYFKKYRKASGDPVAIRAKLDALEGGIAEILEQRDLLESVGLLDSPDKFEEAVRDVELWLEPESNKGNKTGKTNKGNKKREDLPPHLVYNFDDAGIVILVGLSARGNRFVTFKQAHSDDLWLHAHELPGSHVIIRSVQGRAGSLREELETNHPEILEFAAALAAGHSKGRNSALVPVDYTERRHVRAVPGTVALVTYTEPGTLRVRPVDSENITL